MFFQFMFPLKLERGRNSLHLFCKGAIPPGFCEVESSEVHKAYRNGPFKINVFFGPDTPQRRKRVVEVYQGGFVTGEGEGAVLAACLEGEGQVFEKPSKVKNRLKNGNSAKGCMRFGRLHKSRRQCILSRAIHLQKEKLRLRHDRAERCGFLDPSTNSYPGVYTTPVRASAALIP